MAHVNKFPFVSLLALGLAMPAFAQVTPAPAPQAQPPAEREEDTDVVVVTANKREETVQDVAVAVTAVTSEMRDELGIATVTDLTNLTPGLSYTAANERVTLRGIGRNTNNFGAEPGVANYTDGVYQSFATIAGRDNIFTDRIEVLRGPQGTLYGRNSVGGALNIISKRPTDDFEGEFRAGFGSYDQSKIGLSVSGPLLGDWLRGRAVLFKEVRDEGVYYNWGTNDTEGYNINNWNAEVQFEGDVGDRFHWWTKYTTGRYTQAGPPGGRTGGASSGPFNRVLNSGGVNVQAGFAFSGNAAITGYTQCGSLTENPRFTTPGSTDLNSCAARIADLDQYDDFALEMVYEAGPFDIKYVGGYIYYDYNLYDDQDNNPVTSISYRTTSAASLTPNAAGTFIQTINPGNTLDYHENRAFFSNEINFISTWDSPLQWIAGLYLYQENFAQPVSTYLRDEVRAGSAIPVSSFAPFTVTGANIANPDRLLTYTNNKGLNNAYGVFVQSDYAVNDQLKATLGVRYSLDNKNIYEEAELNCFIVCGVPFANITQNTWNGKRIVPNLNTPNPTDTYEEPSIQNGVATSTPTNYSGVTFNPLTGISSRILKDEWSAITGTAGIEWSPDTDTLIFAKYSRGYKTGAYNATNLSPLPKTNPERVDSYELGWKQEVKDWNLTANMSAFLYDYTDIQTPLTEVLNLGLAGETTITALRNIPKVQTTGFELESVWRPLDDLTLRFTYAYLKPEVKESGIYVNNLVPRNVPTTDPTYVNFRQSVEGNVLPQSPENKIAVNATYLFNFEDGTTLLPSISYYWRDSFATDVFNNATELTPAFDQTDARLIWNDADGYFTIIGFVRNAFDQKGYDSVTTTFRANPVTNAVAPAVPCAAASAACYNPTLPVSGTNLPGIYFQNFTQTLPRTWGVELQFHF